VSGNSYLETLIAASIFVPLTIVIVLAWFFLRGAKNDPDEKAPPQGARGRRAGRPPLTSRDTSPWA
jgi:hypothetical protein